MNSVHPEIDHLTHGSSGEPGSADSYQMPFLRPLRHRLIFLAFPHLCDRFLWRWTRPCVSSVNTTWLTRVLYMAPSSLSQLALGVGFSHLCLQVKGLLSSCLRACLELRLYQGQEPSRAAFPLFLIGGTRWNVFRVENHSCFEPQLCLVYLSHQNIFLKPCP